ncbi:MAG: hypothetical protein IPL05_04620 [Betaproteobacteria bacterium]|nr:hypothetical protein [Betaproteobacteria bacterium]
MGELFRQFRSGDGDRRALHLRRAGAALPKGFRPAGDHPHRPRLKLPGAFLALFIADGALMPSTVSLIIQMDIAARKLHPALHEFASSWPAASTASTAGAPCHDACRKRARPIIR